MTEILIANTARFPHDTIDGETLLIDSETGHLLMMTGVGPLLWQLLLGGVAVEPLAAEVVDRFGPAAGEDCRSFLQVLAEAGVVIPATTAVAETPVPGWPDSFAAPVLERYDDIANIITMDPIHDVDQSLGWPRRSGGS